MDHSLILASGSDMRRKMAASSDEPVSSLSREVWSVLAYISENRIGNSTTVEEHSAKDGPRDRGYSVRKSSYILLEPLI